MIITFSSKETEKIFNRGFSKKLPQNMQNLAYRKLLLINAAIDINDLKLPPGNNLEKLKGSRKNQYSIRINNQWRICFSFENSNASNVDIIDYH